MVVELLYNRCFNFQVLQCVSMSSVPARHWWRKGLCDNSLSYIPHVFDNMMAFCSYIAEMCACLPPCVAFCSSARGRVKSKEDFYYLVSSPNNKCYMHESFTAAAGLLIPLFQDGQVFWFFICPGIQFHLATSGFILNLDMSFIDMDIPNGHITYIPLVHACRYLRSLKLTYLKVWKPMKMKTCGLRK
jgi:hypothetical protein